MDDNTVNTPINGATNRTSTESHLNDQPLPNDTLKRTSERTCTQKLTIPTLEKQDYTNANMWWRKFVQYIKMTKDLDLSKMTNNKEILPQYREQLETEIKDIFLWAIGQNANTEMTKTVIEREPSSLPLYNYTHCSDYISHRKETSNTAEPIFSTSNGKTENMRRMYGNEY